MEKKKIAVAISGGVDSSVAAALLLEQGHDICGVTMLVSSDKDGNLDYTIANDAAKVCQQLGIKHHIIDLRKQFYKEVIKPFAKSYAAGRTPNPCIICNEKIKFGQLLKFSQNLGYSYLATGHYLKLIYDENFNKYRIFQAKDQSKDQAYMLYRLRQNVLKNLIFPLADYTKDEVYKIAAKLNLVSKDLKESQDICFINDDSSYSSYLEDEKLVNIKKGYFVDLDGNKLKQHQGLHSYTIGQRKGLGIALGYPAYIVDINYDTGNITLAKEEHLFSRDMIVSDVNWIAEQYQVGDEIEVKVRFSTNRHLAKIEDIKNNDYQIKFCDDIRAITPGQSAVFYRKQELIGGGFISKVF